MTKYLLYRTGLCLLFCLAAGTSPASMTIQSLSGAVTATEISSFKNFMAGETPPSGQTYDNTIADGTAGMEAEALGLMYEVTNDPALLDQMIVYADDFISLRNDLTSAVNGGRRVMWDGNIDPVWLTKPATNSDGSVYSQAGYAGCENNDIVGHIAFCARLILEKPTLWNTTVPDGNPHGYGVTYYQRATNYMAQMDFIQDAYMLKWFINPSTYQIVAPTSSAWTAENESVNAYNREMMFLNGFQRLSECHQLLGDNPARVTEYDAIVKATINVFIAAQQSYTTNSLPVYTWDYAPGSGTEDNTLHSTYDIWGITRAWESGRYGITNATMVPFANTLRYVMNVATNHISYYVNGTSSPNSTRNFIYPGWLPVANFGSLNYFIMANMDIAQGSQASTVIYDALILWVKNARYTGVYPTNDNTADYTISTPWMQTVGGGSNVTAQVTVNPLAGFTGTVNLSVNHLPNGVAASFNPGSITSGSGVSTLTLTASNAAAGGVFGLTNGLTVVATSGIGTRTAPITLVVKPRPTILTTSLTRTNFVIMGTNGFSNATFYLVSSTNLTLPLVQWTPLATNGFGTNGTFNATNPIPPGGSCRYFSIRY